MLTIEYTKNEKRIKIETPYYRPAEAADYCRISRASFDIRAEEIPHTGEGHLKVYHQKVLDQWMNGDLGIPFDKEETAEKPKVR